MVINICQWSDHVREKLEARCRKGRNGGSQIAEEIGHYYQLGLQVVDQASRRVLGNEQVPNEEKVYSIFEPHTELIKRGKAAKPVEFGHMIQIQQVAEKFITGYEVFEKEPNENELVEPALEHHKKLFGDYPDEIAADKSYYKDMATIKKLNKKIKVVSIGKKGRRTEAEAKRESSPAFRLGQRFRAGVEGSISYLKRILGLSRCLNKTWEHYQSTIGAAIFTHNLLILARM